LQTVYEWGPRGYLRDSHDQADWRKMERLLADGEQLGAIYGCRSSGRHPPKD
jgi:hypothetical protein